MNLAKEHVEDSDEHAGPDGDSGFAEWVQIVLIFMHTELNKSFRETEAWFNHSRAIHEEVNLTKRRSHDALSMGTEVLRG